MKRKFRLKFVHVDAFTDVPFGGNPSGVVLNANHLNDEEIIKIAKELNVRETVFVSSSTSADFQFRYMTPKQEIDYSGHSTIAAFHALVDEGMVEIVQDVSMFSLETRTGVIQVEVVKNETTGFHEIQINHSKPKFLDTYDSKVYAESLGLNLVDIMSLYPLQTVDTGIPQLMVPVVSMDALKRVKPDWSKLDDLAKDGDYVSIQVFTKDTMDVTSDAHARHFARSLGVEEDPASGSSAANMGCYLVRHGIIDAANPVTSIVIEQGHIMDRPSKIFVEVTRDREEIRQVKVSGTAVTVLKGEMYI